MKPIVIKLLALALAVGLLLGWSMFGGRSSFRTGLRQYEGLPSTASDITVYRNGNISGTFVADFKISEADFVSFGRERQWDVKPISRSESVFQAKAFHDGRPNDRK